MKKHISYLFNVTLFCIYLPLSALTQENPKNIGNALSFSVSYGMHLPGGDLDDRFGNNFALGTAVEFLHEKHNIILGLDLSILFGNNVEENVLSSLQNEDGLILGTNGSYADIFLRQRGVYTGLSLGKLINLNSNHKKSGIRFSVSPGIFQHWIRLQDDSGTVPQIHGEYAKGYDRLSRGFAIKENIGFQLFSNNKRLNFFAGFEFIQAFTKIQRDIQYDTQNIKSDSRKDLLWGFKIAWHIPLYLGQGDHAQDIFY